MIVFDNIETRRGIIKQIAKGNISKSQIKRLQHDESLELLHDRYYDETNAYLADPDKMTLQQLKYLRELVSNNDTP